MILYQGSKIGGLKTLEPRIATFGDALVYATPSKEIAIIFTRKVGFMNIIAFGKSSDENVYHLIELLPNALKYMYDHKGYIYSFESDDFYGKEKYPNANLNSFELVSNKSVEIENVEVLDSVYDKIIEMGKQGLINIHFYPDRIDECIFGLIDHTIYYLKEHGREITKESFFELLFYHPSLKEEINKKIDNKELNISYITDDDIYNIYKQNANNDLYENTLLILKETYPNIYNKLIRETSIKNR